MVADCFWTSDYWKIVKIHWLAACLLNPRDTWVSIILALNGKDTPWNTKYSICKLHAPKNLKPPKILICAAVHIVTETRIAASNFKVFDGPSMLRCARYFWPEGIESRKIWASGWAFIIGSKIDRKIASTFYTLSGDEVSSKKGYKLFIGTSI